MQYCVAVKSLWNSLIYYFVVSKRLNLMANFYYFVLQSIHSYLEDLHFDMNLYNAILLRHSVSVSR